MYEYSLCCLSSDARSWRCVVYVYSNYSYCLYGYLTSDCSGVFTSEDVGGGSGGGGGEVGVDSAFLVPVVGRGRDGSRRF